MTTWDNYPANDGLANVGWVGLFFFAPLGLVVGLMLAGRRDRRGPIICGLSVVWLVFAVAILSSL